MKKNNKGFSLVELIIVIAIMAILAGALAPSLIKYIAKSRRSTDVSNAQTIATAVTNALSNEKAYDAVSSSGQDFDVDSSGTAYSGTDSFYSEFYSQLGTSKYKPKYNNSECTNFHVVISSSKDTFTVYADPGTKYQLYPDVCSDYQ